MHSRPPRSLPAPNPTPDLRGASRRQIQRPTSTEPPSGKSHARPLILSEVGKIPASQILARPGPDLALMKTRLAPFLTVSCTGDSVFSVYAETHCLIQKKLFFASEKLGFAPERLGFAPERLGLCLRRSCCCHRISCFCPQHIPRFLGVPPICVWP